MKYIRAFFKSISLFVTVVCTGGLMVASLSPYLSPNHFWWISFAGLGYSFLLLTVIFFLIFWIIVRIRLAAIPLAALLFTLPVLLNYISFGFNKHKPEDTKGSVKVMSYNVRSFDLYNWTGEPNTRVNMFKLISDEAPGIACFQEFFTENNNEYNNIRSLERDAGFKYHHVYLDFIGKGGKKWGMATFSRYPIVDSGVVKYPGPTKNACIYTDIRVEGKILRVYNVHLQSVRFEKKDYAYIQEVEEDKKLNAESNYSILSKLKNALIKRAAQVEAIKQHIASSPYPIIVCGDFNDTPVSYAYHKMKEGLHDSFLESGWGIGYTYNGFLPIYRIDYILHDDHFIAYDYHSDRKNYSDHYPVITKIQWKEEKD